MPMNLSQDLARLNVDEYGIPTILSHILYLGSNRYQFWCYRNSTNGITLRIQEGGGQHTSMRSKPVLPGCTIVFDQNGSISVMPPRG